MGSMEEYLDGSGDAILTASLTFDHARAACYFEKQLLRKGTFYNYK